MMRKRLKRTGVILFLLLKCFWADAQEYQHYSYETTEDDYGRYRIFKLRDSVIVKELAYDTLYISNIKDATDHLNMTFDEFVKNFLNYSKQQDSLEGKVYINYFRGLVHTELKKYRYVLKEYSIDFSKESDKKSGISILKKEKQFPENIPDSLNIDFMFVLRGEKNTSNFLNSPKQQLRTIHNILADIHNFKKKNDYKVGVNFYFPDFDFREKRAMAQFAKSVSLIVDSTRINKIRDLPLYFTFDNKEETIPFLLGLTSLVDDVFVINKKEADLFVCFESIKIGENDISVWEQLKNQYYMARFHIGDFPETSAKEVLIEDIEKLAVADYTDATWEYYLFSIISVLFLLVIGFVCYIFIPAFANFVNENSMYVFAVGILLVLEIYLLFVFMIEGISKAVIFSFQNNNLMLFLPLMIMFAIPVIKKIIGERQNP